MQSILLLGEKGNIENYITKFISQNNIKTYNIIRFHSKIKISDVREIQKTLSIKTEQGEKRVIIISSNVTFDAQHAFLKTLEELPDSTDILITSDSNHRLIPTIISRCRIIRLPQEEDKVSTPSGIRFEFKDLMLLSYELGVNKDESKEKFKELILNLRQSLIEEILLKGESNLKMLNIKYEMLNKLLVLYPLVINNNVNPRFALESTLIEIAQNYPLDK